MTFVNTIRGRLGLLAMAAALGLASATLPLAAQEFSESHLEAAREAIEAAHASEQFDRILPVVADQAKALFQRSNPGAVQDIDIVVSEVALELAARRPALQKELEELWAARLSEQELKDITAFYTSPTGQKFGQIMPAIIQDSVRAAGIWRDGLSTEIVTRSREELRKRGHNF
ncbi:DUF2059 domain-containing protein [Methylobrevis pamukkalensis]|uniref:DUF2059 domain-containing protein n=1 Tax=Methylobrevis pamukkalensis TaxID=1439726 RepID=A0A1E3H2P1_9HYPH|nr:DUF2059 domain-containing protein [Methylobrevis pamukkalensis]ODN70582.1 hypothetical protein A6302_02070 [Methylobrevis pamukkalensis]